MLSAMPGRSVSYQCEGSEFQGDDFEGECRLAGGSHSKAKLLIKDMSVFDPNDPDYWQYEQGSQRYQPYRPCTLEEIQEDIETGTLTHGVFKIKCVHNV